MNAARHPSEPVLDLADIDDSRVLAIGMVPANTDVLHLGRIDTSVAGCLKGMGCRVWGVTSEPEVGDSDVYETIIGADLNSLDFLQLVGDKKFDVVLMLDLLEYLGNPPALLQALAKVVRENGWGVISIPNVGHASLRLGLLQGRFNYSDSGLLNRNQLRFFDRRGVDDLLEEAGWQLFDLVRVLVPLDMSELPADAVDAEVVRRFESDVEALTRQFVLAVAPSGSPVLRKQPVLPAALAQRALFEARNRSRELDEEVRRLNRHHLPDLGEQLDDIRQKVFERRAKLKDILSAIRES